MINRIAFVLAASVSVLVAAHPVSAAGGASPVDPWDADSSAPAREARVRFEEGVDFIKRSLRERDPKSLDLAYLKFKQALGIYPQDPSGKILWNLTELEVRTGRWLEADEHLRQFETRQHAGSDPNHQFHQLYLNDVERVRSMIGHIEVTAPTGNVVRVDGVTGGAVPLGGPLSLVVTPGDHTVTVDGHDRKVTVKAGTTERVDLLPAQAPAAVSVPAVAPNTEPAPTGRASAAAPASSAEHLPASDADDHPSHSAQIAAVTAFGALAVGSVIVGAVLQHSAGENLRTAQSTLSSFPTPSEACSPSASSALCEALSSHRAAYHRDIALAPAMYAGAGVFLALGVGSLFYLAPHDDRQPTARVTPIISPTTIGAAFQADF